MAPCKLQPSRRYTVFSFTVEYSIQLHLKTIAATVYLYGQLFKLFHRQFTAFEYVHESFFRNGGDGRMTPIDHTRAASKHLPQWRADVAGPVPWSRVAHGFQFSTTTIRRRHCHCARMQS